MSAFKRAFYAGVRPCGCMTAMLVDDEKTTAKELASFARDMAKTGRTVKHVEFSSFDAYRDAFGPCRCAQPTAAPSGHDAAQPHEGNDEH